MNESDMQRKIWHWLERLVVGEGLCPFAAQPLHNGLIRLAMCPAEDDQAVYRFALQEIEQLVLSDPSELETTLIETPKALESFDDYLESLTDLEQALQDLQLDTVLQIASFHPDYLFDGEDADDVSHYSNRAPCPLFHLIRQDSLTQALQHYPDPAAIPLRNQQHLRDLGLQGLHRLLGDAFPHSADDG